MKQGDYIALVTVVFCTAATVMFEGPDEFLAIGAFVLIIHMLTRSST